MNVVICDDHQIVRDAVKLYLEAYEPIQRIDEFDNGQAVIQHLRNSDDISLVIIDINMDKMNGIEATRQLAKEFKSVKILALTMHSDYQHIKSMMDAGASGYLLKSCNEQEMHEAITQIMEGGTYYSSEVAQTIMNNFSRKKSSATDIPFTPREKEIYRLVLKEKSNQEIAEALFISVRTVEVHKRNLMEKTGAKNSAGLVLYAVKNNLFEDF